MLFRSYDESVPHLPTSLSDLSVSAVNGRDTGTIQHSDCHLNSAFTPLDPHNQTSFSTGLCRLPLFSSSSGTSSIVSASLKPLFCILSASHLFIVYPPVSVGDSCCRATHGISVCHQ